jgi:hypothetical protein
MYALFYEELVVPDDFLLVERRRFERRTAARGRDGSALRVLAD